MKTIIKGDSLKKHAILVMAHDISNLKILKKTIEILDSDFFDIFLHIDKKSKIQITDIEKCKKSKLFIYKEIKVYWGHRSQVECELFLIKKALNQNENYEYYHLISGVDFPLKKPEEIHFYFHKSYGKEFIHFKSLTLDELNINWIKYYRFIKTKNDNSIFRKIDLMLLYLQMAFKINRLKNFNVKFFTGSNWFSITDKFARFVIDNEDKIKKLKYVVSYDEIFMQTILYNSKFRKNLYYQKFDDNYDSCKRLINWKKGNPYTWKMEDLKIIEESDFFFARKFDYNIDGEIIDYIYEKLKDDNEYSK